MSKAVLPKEGSFNCRIKTDCYNYVKKTGYLVKSPSAGRIGRWRKRWFMLVDLVEPGPLTGTPERQVRLEYYDVTVNKKMSPTELPNKKGMISLRNCIAVVAHDEKLKSYDHVINIIMSNFRVYHLVAKCEQERDDWIVAMNDFIFNKPVESQSYLTRRANLAESVYPNFETSLGQWSRGNVSQLSSTPDTEGSLFSSSGCFGSADSLVSTSHTRENIISNKTITSSHSVDFLQNLLKDDRLESSGIPFEIADESDRLLQIQLSNGNITMISRSNIVAGEVITNQNSTKTCRGIWQISSGTQQQVIIKSCVRDQTMIMKEGLTMCKLMHPNIIKLLGAVLVDTPKLLVIEFCERGTLTTVLKDHLRLLERSVTTADELKLTLLKYSRYVALGLNVLKEMEVVHGCLKAGNILVSNDDICKISGFGESLKVKDELYQLMETSFKGPVQWTAPEVILESDYSLASDAWSFGVILYEIWSLGCEPYHNSPTQEFISSILKGLRLYPPPGVPKEIYRLMMELWHPSPSKRPVAELTVKYLIQPDGDILYTTKPPKCIAKNLSQLVTDAHTLGSDINSGEILYRNLQQAYVGFSNGEEMRQTQSLSSTWSDQKVSQDYGDVSSPYYENIGKILPKTPKSWHSKATQKLDAAQNIYEKGFGSNSSPVHLQLSESVSELKFSQETSPVDYSPLDDESNIYWNDSLLPPVSLEGSKKSESATMELSYKTLLPQSDTATLSRFWNISSSSEDESQTNSGIKRSSLKVGKFRSLNLSKLSSSCSLLIPDEHAAESKVGSRGRPKRKVHRFPVHEFNCQRSSSTPTLVDLPGKERWSPRKERWSPGKERWSPGKERWSPGKERLSPGNERLSPGKERLNPGKERLSPGNERLSPGNERLSPGNEWLSPGKERLSPGNERLSPGNERLRPGNEWLSPGKERLSPGKEMLSPVSSNVKDDFQNMPSDIKTTNSETGDPQNAYYNASALVVFGEHPQSPETPSRNLDVPFSSPTSSENEACDVLLPAEESQDIKPNVHYYNLDIIPPVDSSLSDGTMLISNKEGRSVDDGTGYYNTSAIEVFGQNNSEISLQMNGTMPGKAGRSVDDDTGYYNTSAIEVFGQNNSEISDGTMPGKARRSVDDGTGYYNTSAIEVFGQNNSEISLQMDGTMPGKAGRCVDDDTGYYNTSAIEVFGQNNSEISDGTMPGKARRSVDDGTGYYNTSAIEVFGQNNSEISLQMDIKPNVHYYNLDIIPPVDSSLSDGTMLISNKEGRSVDDGTGYYNTSAIEVFGQNNSEISDGTMPGKARRSVDDGTGYYNTSAIEVFGQNNSEISLQMDIKPNVHYYNLDIIAPVDSSLSDGTMLISNKEGRSVDDGTGYYNTSAIEVLQGTMPGKAGRSVDDGTGYYNTSAIEVFGQNNSEISLQMDGTMPIAGKEGRSVFDDTGCYNMSAVEEFGQSSSEISLQSDGTMSIAGKEGKPVDEGTGYYNTSAIEVFGQTSSEISLQSDGTMSIAGKEGKPMDDGAGYYNISAIEVFGHDNLKTPAIDPDSTNFNWKWGELYASADKEKIDREVYTAGDNLKDPAIALDSTDSTHIYNNWKWGESSASSDKEKIDREVYTADDNLKTPAIDSDSTNSTHIYNNWKWGESSASSDKKKTDQEVYTADDNLKTPAIDSDSTNSTHIYNNWKLGESSASSDKEKTDREVHTADDNLLNSPAVGSVIDTSAHTYDNWKWEELSASSDKERINQEVYTPDDSSAVSSENIYDNVEWVSASSDKKKPDQGKVPEAEKFGESDQNYYNLSGRIAGINRVASPSQGEVQARTLVHITPACNNSPKVRPKKPMPYVRNVKNKKDNMEANPITSYPSPNSTLSTSPTPSPTHTNNPSPSSTRANNPSPLHKESILSKQKVNHLDDNFNEAKSTLLNSFPKQKENTTIQSLPKQNKRLLDDSSEPKVTGEHPNMVSKYYSSSKNYPELTRHEHQLTRVFSTPVTSTRGETCLPPFRESSGMDILDPTLRPQYPSPWKPSTHGSKISPLVSTGSNFVKDVAGVSTKNVLQVDAVPVGMTLTRTISAESGVNILGQPLRNTSNYFPMLPPKVIKRPLLPSNHGGAVHRDEDYHEAFSRTSKGEASPTGNFFTAQLKPISQ